MQHEQLGTRSPSHAGDATTPRVHSGDIGHSTIQMLLVAFASGAATSGPATLISGSSICTGSRTYEKLVILKGTPTATPRSGSKSRPQRLTVPSRVETKDRRRPSADQRGLSSHPPRVRGCGAPAPVETTPSVEPSASWGLVSL